jgi:CRISPR-associated protein Csx17
MVVIFLGTLSLALGKSRKGREAVPQLPTLRETWVTKADDGSPEFRCAAAVAGLGRPDMPMKPFVFPVRQNLEGGWGWHPESRVAVWGEGRLIANVCRVVARRQLEADRAEGSVKPFLFRAGAASGDVTALLMGKLDEDRVAGLVAGLVQARVPERLASEGQTAALPAAYCVLKPFFVPDSLLSGFLPSGRALPLPRELMALLKAGHVQDALDIAWRRLHAAGFPLPRHPNAAPSAAGVDGPRLLAALAVPVEPAEVVRCFGSLARQDVFETA